ncbi:invasion associated locus B family protein [Rhodoligotrophos defluvii]|uniref:invasion associated locus B family protein n=1 Tax=Rhodoligotrophos defluvii TaxID=2561934 RepID=UPI0010C97310|nr:invasion associated locus B family protein [Rhodoligotrophos defluvii]
MTSRGTLVAFCLMAALAASALPRDVAAQTQNEPQLLGDFNDWAAYTYNTQKGKVCYIVAKPSSSEPNNVKRDPIFLLVTHRTADKVRNEVSTIIGYPFKKDAPALVTIDGTNYEMFTNGDGGWFDSSTKDSQVVSAMKAGHKLTIKGTSWRGTETTDTYSLAGVTAAMKAIDQACE